MVAYCKDKYAKFHGTDDGWDALLTSVAAEDALPARFREAHQSWAGFAAAPAAPRPAEINRPESLLAGAAPANFVPLLAPLCYT